MDYPDWITLISKELHSVLAAFFKLAAGMAMGKGDAVWNRRWFDKCPKLGGIVPGDLGTLGPSAKVVFFFQE
jgi:hypothetical protein